MDPITSADLIAKFPQLLTNPEFIAVVAGVVLRLATWVASKWGISAQTSVLVLAVVLGIGYTVFVSFFPSEIQSRVVPFVSIAVAASWIIYEWIWKPIAGKLSGSK